MAEQNSGCMAVINSGCMADRNADCMAPSTLFHIYLLNYTFDLSKGFQNFNRIFSNIPIRAKSKGTPSHIAKTTAQ